MAQTLYSPPEGYGIIILCWLLFTIATPLVAIRLYVVFHFRSRPWRELLVVTAWVVYFGNTILFSLLNDWDQFNYNIDTDSPGENPTPAEKQEWWVKREHRYKAVYANAIIYKVSIYLCKMALLCFFNDISPKQLYPKTWKLIAFTWVTVILGTAYQILYNLLDCWPFHLNYSSDDEHNTCAIQPALLMTSWTLHMFTYLLVCIIPFVILNNLKNLTQKQKMVASAMFAGGFFNVACATVLLVQYYIPYEYFNDEQWLRFESVCNYMFPLQQGTALILVCLPQLRRFCMGISAESLRPELKNISKQSKSDLESGGTLVGSSTVKSHLSVITEEKGTAIYTCAHCGKDGKLLLSPTSPCSQMARS